jgi:mannosyltransferase OCH1-like enzyme
MINKIVHYCWFGNNKKSSLVLECIDSWKKFLPDYEIKEWNESNIDLTNSFVKVAYDKKKWAFLSDYVRLVKVYEYGGIYMDTDMLIIKNIDFFLKYECFFGAENLNFFNCAIFGANQKNGFIKKCVDYYDSLTIAEDFDFNTVIIPNVITKIFNFENNFDSSFANIVELNRIVIYPSDYFYPLPFNKMDYKKNYKKYLTENTYAVHLWSGSWLEYTEFELIQKRQYVKAFKLAFFNFFFKNKLSILYLKNLLFSTIFSFKKNEF